MTPPPHNISLFDDFNHDQPDRDSTDHLRRDANMPPNSHQPRTSQTI